MTVLEFPQAKDRKVQALEWILVRCQVCETKVEWKAAKEQIEKLARDALK